VICIRRYYDVVCSSRNTHIEIHTASQVNNICEYVAQRIVNGNFKIGAVTITITNVIGAYLNGIGT
jgi:hypothetical protein